MSIDARVQALLTSLGDAGDGVSETTDADSASEAENASAPLEGASESGAESASADTGEVSGQPPASPEAPTTADEALQLKHQMLEEKLAALREENRLRREKLEAETAAAQRAREEAEADRKAAAAERAKFEGLGKKGAIKDTLAALGIDTRDHFEAMKAEALEAGSPEAVERRLRERLEAEREAIKRELEESVGPLKQTIEQLQKERAELAKQAAEAHFESDFQAKVTKYDTLRVEYEDAELLDIARRFRDNPERLYAQAELVGLTLPPKSFTMDHILGVLRATQEQHERKRQERQAKLQPAETPKAPSNGAPKTVNGTTEKRNAGSALGNDLASSRASGAPEKPRLTWDQRVSKLAEGR